MIQIDQRGDLEIWVQDPTSKTETVFIVCSRTLARASPTWESSLFSSESELCIQSSLTESMTSQETDVLEIILHTFHQNMSEIPAHMSLHQLLLLLQMGRRYQVTSPLSIWGIQWFKNTSLFSETTSQAAIVLTCRMLIANELGLSGMFHESMRDVASKLLLDSDGNLGFFHSDRRFQHLRKTYLQDEKCAGTFVVPNPGRIEEA